MEENRNDQAGTQAENMGNEAQGAAENGKEQKLFTQEEVNSFVQSRVARLRGQVTKDAQAEYSQKLAELQAREMKLLVKEQLSERGMPGELAEVITCVDDKDLANKLDMLQKIYGSSTAQKEEKPQGFIQIGAPGSGGSGLGTLVDPVRKAMGLR